MNFVFAIRESLRVDVGGCMKTITDTCLRLGLAEGPYGSTPCLLRAKRFSCTYKNNSHMGRKSSRRKARACKWMFFFILTELKERNAAFAL